MRPPGGGRGGAADAPGAGDATGAGGTTGADGAGDPWPEPRRAYYRELARNYATTIRQLVPDYDGMVEALVGLVRAAAPRALLDVGCGPGELTARLAEAVPEGRIVALEVSCEMAAEARRRLAPLGLRAEVVERDLLEATVEDGNRGGLPGAPFDLVHSNLVLHNLPLAGKRRALKAVRGLLSPGGVIVWGDLVRFADPRLQRARVEARIRHARKAGCPEDLLEWNFRKEAEEDFPLTTEGTLDLLREVGFAGPEAAWARDTFLVVWARRGGTM